MPLFRRSPCACYQLRRQRQGSDCAPAPTRVGSRIRHDDPVANGKPLDHPLTDILNHEMEVFGPACDSLIREIVQLGGTEQMESELNVWRLDPRFPTSEPVDLARLEDQLINLRDRLLIDRHDRGWEVGGHQ